MIFLQEKAKEEDREKLGEKEETIPPDYRLEEVKVNRLGSFSNLFLFILNLMYIKQRDMGTDLGYKDHVS